MASTLDKTFVEFKEWIMTLFAQTFSPKATTFIHPDMYQLFGDKMLNEYDYTETREQFLISQAKLYVKICLDRSLSHNTCTTFLEKLMNKIADCLSYYVMNKYPIPENGKSKNKLRIRVKAELKKTLFDDNAYIVYLKQKQVANHDFRQKSKSERKKTIQEKHRKDVMDAFRRTCQIRGVFTEAQHTPRRKR